tara:strand:+ start:125 stop:322 length:198 start_codon:yes stop_codon:yes gene_type:complete
VIYIKKINIFKDARGTLAVLENKNFKFFSIKRSFFIDFKKKKFKEENMLIKNVHSLFFVFQEKLD